MSKITGKRPKPTVAKDHSPSFNTNNTGRHPGVRAGKTPTGSRPVPKVAKNTPREPSAPGGGKKAPSTMSMPRPKTNWAKRGGGKPHGGR